MGCSLLTLKSSPVLIPLSARIIALQWCNYFWTSLFLLQISFSYWCSVGTRCFSHFTHRILFLNLKIPLVPMHFCYLLFLFTVKLTCNDIHMLCNIYSVQWPHFKTRIRARVLYPKPWCVASSASRDALRTYFHILRRRGQSWGLPAGDGKPLGCITPVPFFFINQVP